MIIMNLQNTTFLSAVIFIQWIAQTMQCTGTKEMNILKWAKLRQNIYIFLNNKKMVRGNKAGYKLTAFSFIFA